MINIIDYISLSKTAYSVSGVYTNPRDFEINFKGVHSIEQRSFIRHYLVNNIPFLFENNPILFEQLVQYLADKLEISPSEIKLIGSAKTGFSISAPPEYGRAFSSKSDLDFSIINEDLFNTLQEEFYIWSDQYKMKVISAKNDREKTFWDNNIIEVPMYQIENGFVDTYKIPNLPDLPTTRNINNSLSLIVINLKENFSIEVKGASARVYNSWFTFLKQVMRNTNSIMGKI